MESLDETFGPRVSLGRRRTRLLAGAGLLLAGVPAAAIGLHGLVLGLFARSLGQAAAAQTAIALVGLFVPAAFAVAVLRLPAARPVKLAAVGGVVLATLAAALFLITVPTGAFATGTIPADVVLLYLAGTVVAVGAPIATIGAALAAADGGRPAGPRSLPRSRDRSATPPAAASTDGGRDGDRLEFLLDDGR